MGGLEKSLEEIAPGISSNHSSPAGNPDLTSPDFSPHIEVKTLDHRTDPEKQNTHRQTNLSVKLAWAVELRRKGLSDEAVARILNLPAGKEE